jgi:hypothetical protein
LVVSTERSVLIYSTFLGRTPWVAKRVTGLLLRVNSLASKLGSGRYRFDRLLATDTASPTAAAEDQAKAHQQRDLVQHALGPPLSDSVHGYFLS